MSLLSRLSFQLYSARNFPPLASQLATLHDLGYQNVEPFGGLYGDIVGFSTELKAHNLAAPTGHFGIDQLEDGFASALNVAQTLKMSVVICPYLVVEHRPNDAAGWKAFGARLSAVRQKLARHDIGFGWHNHDFEVMPLADGTMPLDHILGADQDLKWEADIGWIARAGQDPVHWLQKYSGRVAALHVKDIAPKAEPVVEDGWADVGHGTLNWAQIIPAGLKAGAQNLVVEHDNPADFHRFASRSIATVKGWQF